ncbi:12326_t:CDS:2 [Acaulospora colombiana]|uniref:12326_t:CDS:1 n=1 Tax=Acaulospora colombiana TaxID=27376 RepID=A0ACA9L0N4_9GLOM|nr:12326_t:CDS:2 [Acaulospora colombiana]
MDAIKDKPERTLRLVFLLADTPIPEVVERYGDYGKLFSRLLQKAIESGPNKNLTLKIQSFEVQKMEFPDRNELLETDGIIISGSSASAYDDIPWINRLTDFTKFLIENHPNVKIIGVCFGHQIIAKAMGGKVIKNPIGWEVAVTEILLNEDGRKFFNTDKKFLDHVCLVPPDFTNLGSTEISSIQGMVKGNHVFTIQGHPEFVGGVVKELVKHRQKKGIFDPEFSQMCLKAADQDDDSLLIGQKFIEFLLVNIGFFESKCVS